MYHKPLKLRVCNWRVLVITGGRLVANAYTCHVLRACLWGSFVYVYLLWEERQCTETRPKGLRDRVTMAALYPQLIPLLFDAPLYMYGYVHTCCPSTYSPEGDSCIDPKALPVWHLYRYYTGERWLFLCYWRARIQHGVVHCMYSLLQSLLSFYERTMDHRFLSFILLWLCIPCLPVCMQLMLCVWVAVRSLQFDLVVFPRSSCGLQSYSEIISPSAHYIAFLASFVYNFMFFHTF